MENIELIAEHIESILEVRASRKTVVRGGKLVKRTSCPEGYQFDRKTQKCVRITAADKMARKFSTRQMLRTRKAHKGINRVHAAKSLRLSKRFEKRAHAKAIKYV